MTDMELAEEIEKYGLSPHLKDQIIAALRRGHEPRLERVLKNEAAFHCLLYHCQRALSMPGPHTFDKELSDGVHAAIAISHGENEHPPSGEMVMVPRDIGELAQDMVATMGCQPGYKLAITHGRILRIAKEICRLYELSKLSAAEAEGRKS